MKLPKHYACTLPFPSTAHSGFSMTSPVMCRKGEKVRVKDVLPEKTVTAAE